MKLKSCTICMFFNCLQAITDVRRRALRPVSCPAAGVRGGAEDGSSLCTRWQFTLARRAERGVAIYLVCSWTLFGVDLAFTGMKNHGECLSTGEVARQSIYHGPQEPMSARTIVFQLSQKFSSLLAPWDVLFLSPLCQFVVGVVYFAFMSPCFRNRWDERVLWQRRIDSAVVCKRKTGHGSLVACVCSGLRHIELCSGLICKKQTCLSDKTGSVHVWCFYF